MQFTNGHNRYGWISIFLHWGIAIGLIGLFALGVWMVDLDYYSDWYHDAPFIHKSIGVILIGSMLIRWGWNQISPTPKRYEGVNHPLVARAVHAIHQFFYLLVILIGISGYLISTAEGQGISVFGWFEVPALPVAFDGQADIAGELHELLAYGLIALAVLHALAAIKHHFVNKDNTLKRMLTPNS